MQDIGGMRARIEAAGELAGLAGGGVGRVRGAGGWLPGVRGAGGRVVRGVRVRSGGGRAGRLVLASAPSLDAGSRGEAGCGGSVSADLEVAADGLAGLAGLLAARLSSAARQAGDPGDRDACGQAGAEAARVCGLLARR